MRSRGLVSIVLATLFGCGPGNPSNGNNNDSNKPTIDMKMNGNSDGTDGMDGGDGKDGPTGTNRPPRVVLVDRDGVAVKDLKVRAGMDWAYQVRAEDPDGDDPLECKLKIRDQGAKSLYDSGWTTCGSFKYNMVGEGTYDLEMQAKDAKGMEGPVYNATAMAMKNVPPTVVLPPTNKFNPMNNRPVYQAQVGKKFCIDLGNSYDDRGISRYKNVADVNDGTESSSPSNSNLCAIYPEAGIFVGYSKVVDDEEVESSPIYYEVEVN